MQNKISESLNNTEARDRNSKSDSAGDNITKSGTDLARGANKKYVDHPWINPNTIEHRQYQDEIAAKACQKNSLIVLPTGLGKTNIAVLVVANRFQKNMNAKILMLAPTKPLVEQHRKSFEKFLKLGPELKTITGAIAPDARAVLYNKSDIVFSTPQTIENDLRQGILNLKEYSLLIVDEAHRSVGNYAYVFVAEQYMKNAHDPLILALTASPGASRQRINDIKKKLFIEQVEIKERDDIDVKPYVQKLSQAFIHVDLLPELRKIVTLLSGHKNTIISMLMSWKIIRIPKISKVELLRLQAYLAKTRSGSGLAALSYIAEILKIDHALILAETQSVTGLKKYLENFEKEQSKAAQRLVKTLAFQQSLDIAKSLCDHNIEHPKMQRLEQLIKSEMIRNRRVMIFAQYRDTIEIITKRLKQIPDAKPVAFFGQAKKSGHGMSQKEQIQILNEFKLGFYNILACTSIGEEGLDISETDTVIFYEPIPSEIRKIQRSGRTARSRAGKVLVMITKGTRDEAFYWSGYHKEQKMKKILYDMKNKQDG
ncbi:MAG: DEAD/DEAH box helicase family protein [Candidatus Aenigmarchaeota archaeon]|nr:DEAD/DEAH box helicase family protein [Candidatus Aenigmarchaeota archaeon]